MAIKFLKDVVGLLIGIVVVEVLLRLLGVSYPSFYRADPLIGMSLRPGAEGWFVTEGRAYVRINSGGLRDLEHCKAKPPNTLRIAVLGDSTAEAMQLPMEQAFWAVLERDLAHCQCLEGLRTEVINFGMSGMGLAQQYILLQHRVFKYDPDVVILTITTHRSIRNNSRALNFVDYVPYYVYRGDDLVLDNSFRQSRAYQRRQSWLGQLGYKVINYSRILQVIKHAKATAPNGIPARVPGRNPEASPNPLIEQGIDSRVYSKPSDPQWQEAWRITEELIILMAKSVAEKGRHFVIVTTTQGVQVLPDRAEREDFVRSLGLDDLDYAERRIKALGQTIGTPVLNLAGSMRQYAERRGVFLHGYGGNGGKGHWNPEGHRVAGELISQWICSHLDLSRSIAGGIVTWREMKRTEPQKPHTAGRQPSEKD